MLGEMLPWAGTWAISPSRSPFGAYFRISLLTWIAPLNVMGIASQMTYRLPLLVCSKQCK